MTVRTPSPGPGVVVRKGLVILCFMLALAASASQDARLPLQLRISRDTGVMCSDPALKLAGSRTVRTPQLISADGRRRAYAEVEADAFQMALGRRQECSHTSKLYVAGPNDQSFKLAFVQEPISDFLLNWIVLVDWSPDSRYLLLEMGFGQWLSDAGGFVVRIYDAQLGVFTSVDLANDALSKYVGKDCEAQFQALGFSGDSKVILKTGPNVEEGDEVPTTDSCVKQVGLWLLDPHTMTMSTLPDYYHVRSYGSFKGAH